ncbi:flagellar protein FlaG [Clostridium sp. LBM24168]
MGINNISQGGQLPVDNTSAAYVEEGYSAGSINGKIAEKVFVKENKSTKPITEENVKKAVDKFNALLEENPTHLEYEIYGKFKDTVIKIVDDNSKKVIKELPPKNIIDMVEKFCELAGFFVNEKA